MPPRPIPDLDPAARLLVDALPRPRLTSIVDVGAAPYDQPAYAPLMRAGACHVTGFEPHPESFARVNAAKGPFETYHNRAVGHGGPQQLNFYRIPTMTSIFQPHMPGMRMIGGKRWGIVDGSDMLDTVALDAMEGLGPVDCLKIDIQGGEVAVFQGGRRVLAEAVCIIVEARLLQLYEDEPMIAGVDHELRGQGFMFHKFLHVKHRPMPSSQGARLRRGRHNDQAVDGDAVYFRHPGRVEGYSDAQLMHAALIASAVVNSHSAALYFLDELVLRKIVPDTLPRDYVDALPARLRTDADPGADDAAGDAAAEWADDLPDANR